LRFERAFLRLLDLVVKGAHRIELHPLLDGEPSRRAHSGVDALIHTGKLAARQPRGFRTSRFGAIFEHTDSTDSARDREHPGGRARCQIYRDGRNVRG
jgi:hypothetical protein